MFGIRHSITQGFGSLPLVTTSISYHPLSVAMAESQTSTSAAWCAFYGIGIIGTLLLYGITQEGIMTVAYDGSLFQYSVSGLLLRNLD